MNEKRDMYYLGNYEKTESGYKLNSAYLCDSVDGEPIVNGFHLITKKGYNSKKDVIVDLDVIGKLDGELIISEQCAKSLIEKYGKEGKTFSRWNPDSKASVHVALSKHITDPHDNS